MTPTSTAAMKPGFLCVRAPPCSSSPPRRPRPRPWAAPAPRLPPPAPPPPSRPAGGGEGVGRGACPPGGRRALRLIEALVGPPEEVGGGPAAVRPDGHADAHGRAGGLRPAR